MTKKEFDDLNKLVQKLFLEYLQQGQEPDSDSVTHGLFQQALTNKLLLAILTELRNMRPS